MIIIKAYRSWVHVGPMPLLRALVLDGAIYYLVFVISFAMELVANTSNVVGRLHFTVSDRSLLIGYSCITP
jgi:hypothetical protein